MKANVWSVSVWPALAIEFEAEPGVEVDDRLSAEVPDDLVARYRAAAQAFTEVERDVMHAIEDTSFMARTDGR